MADKQQTGCGTTEAGEDRACQRHAQALSHDTPRCQETGGNALLSARRGSHECAVVGRLEHGLANPYEN